MKNIYSESINETLFHSKHESGLDIYVLPKRGYSQSYGVFAVHYGSNDSEFVLPGSNKSMTVPDGIAHFLEHKMFEQQKGSVFDEFADLGASPNAYTNFTTTAYLFTTTANVRESVELLLKKVQNPYFTDESIEKEKGIISQEIKMYEDNPNWRVYFNLLNCLFVRYPVKKEIPGTIESISSINKELLYDCYTTFYNPSNAMFLLVGDVDPYEIDDLAGHIISRNGNIRSEVPKRVYPHEPSDLNRAIAEENLSVSMPLFAIGLKDRDVGYGGRDLLKKELETSILLEGLFGGSSLIFRELYDEGLINNAFSSDYVGEKDYGYSLIGGESREPHMVYDTIKRYISNPAAKVIEEDMFNRIKRKFIGQFVSSFNSVEYIGSNFVSYYMKNIDFLNYLDVIKEIRYENIKDRFEDHISEENMVISIVNPYIM